HASLGGAPYLRRRYPGGVGRLLERGRRAHVVLTGPVERHLHRPGAVRGVQPPHKSLLAPRDRPVRQPPPPATTQPPGDTPPRPPPGRPSTRRRAPPGQRGGDLSPAPRRGQGGGGLEGRGGGLPRLPGGRVIAWSSRPCPPLRRGSTRRPAPGSKLCISGPWVTDAAVTGGLPPSRTARPGLSDTPSTWMRQEPPAAYGFAAGRPAGLPRRSWKPMEPAGGRSTACRRRSLTAASTWIWNPRR